MQSFTTGDGVEVAYRSLGAGPEAVMLLHGWMATGAVWDEILPELTGFRLTVPELRGGVASKAPSATITLDRLAADVLELLARVEGRVHLVGHSMGGQVAMSVAAAAHGRVRSLSLLSTVPPDGLALPAEVAATFRAAGANRSALGGIVDAACKTLTARAREALVDAAACIDPASIAAAFDAWSRGGVALDALSGIECPTLVIASDDPFLPEDLLSDKVIRRIEGARLSRLRGPGHYPQLEAPRETAALLTDFWCSTT